MPCEAAKLSVTSRLWCIVGECNRPILFEKNEKSGIDQESSLHHSNLTIQYKCLGRHGNTNESYKTT